MTKDAVRKEKYRSLESDNEKGLWLIENAICNTERKYNDLSFLLPNL